MEKNAELLENPEAKQNTDNQSVHEGSRNQTTEDNTRTTRPLPSGYIGF